MDFLERMLSEKFLLELNLVITQILLYIIFQYSRCDVAQIFISVYISKLT